jgi:hypothetical protein
LSTKAGEVHGGVINILEHAVLALAMGIVCRYIAASLAGNQFKNFDNLKINTLQG